MKFYWKSEANKLFVIPRPLSVLRILSYSNENYKCIKSLTWTYLQIRYHIYNYYYNITGYTCSCSLCLFQFIFSFLFFLLIQMIHKF